MAQTLKRISESKRVKPVVDIFDNLMGSIQEPLVVLDTKLTVVKANRSFYETFAVRPADIEGRLVYRLGKGQWNIPKLRQLLEDTLSGNAACPDFELEHVFETIGRKIMHFNARLIYTRSNKTRLILLAIEDVTDRENDKRNLEDLVTRRTAELMRAKEEAEHRKQIAEDALAEIKTLKNQLEAERAYLQDEIKLAYNHESIIGQSDGLNYVLYKIEQIAKNDTIVLILGETGTGKELVARAIHNVSLRKDRALVKVNCATLSANLIESELFGHEKGSFTGSVNKHLGRFEVSSGSTLFLDEIGELPVALQAKMLRVIQDGEFERIGSSRTLKVDTRIIVATNRNLEAEVKRGNFREDLWYRLNVFPITIPPLRDRRGDIPLLVDFFVKKIARRMGKTIDVIPKGAMEALENYPWPGNVRELENVLERAVINSTGPKLCLVDELKKPFRQVSQGQKTLESVEREHIIRTLEQTKWKVSGKNSAAEILGLNRSTLRARMRKLNIRKP